ncbi:ImmA/IrrE family metallo-endopeptidase [Marixanthomonas sp. SCSIO 43207]|uniref:ImmA/IrrE family metallo-endopeptidase n=1 Tax=Marixanthomonas sp. SCSIO 43207 TaxID=2779360 RepID=UPI001CA954FB|nr:ImmA/IrrE family metallo-endopeptidase [Marixanthomonas sp. SCSIO 43207]UAB82415.1 ImmA/IrrE family metallo-endopeptidase [Marixanthomonas sp. SCSIO 43207]
MATINDYYPESVTHPSEFLIESLEEKNIGAKEFAIKTGKPEKTITAVLKGESSITPDMAVLFEQVLKIPAHFWNEAQRNYDEYEARVNFQKNIEQCKEWARNFPYAKMVKYGWVKKTRKAEEKVIELFKFFEVASQKGFEDYYYNQRTRVAFRISLKNQENATAIAAWLRRGELQAYQINTPEFNKNLFKKKLHEIKALMAKQPRDFFEELHNICKSAGVKVVHTPCLPKAPIHGSTRWIKDAPLIQLSGRYKRNDIFWFTFFHEVGHILLHGKKYISIENIDVDGENKEFEKEADEFASDWILSKKEENEILNSNPLTYEDIINYAKKFGTHPACIIGRFQHKRRIPYGTGNELFEPINFESQA